MEKGNNGHYIRQLAENENLYSYLQRQTLEEVHRLSGKVWTDFNAHDPGVTLVDIANYALTEMDYKLGFGTMDYLTGEDGIFKPERFGLFPPERCIPLPLLHRRIIEDCSSPAFRNWKTYGWNVMRQPAATLSRLLFLPLKKRITEKRW